MDKIEKLKDCSRELQALIEELESAKQTQLNSNQEETSKQLIGELKYRVIHFNGNPAQRVLEQKLAEIEKIKWENERLRARLSLLETGNSADLTYRIDDAVNSAGRIEQLKKKVETLKDRENKILNSFKKTSRVFREACYQLIGYRIDPLKDGVFRLTHMYDDHEDHRLYFEVKSDGTTNLLENEYLSRYKKFIANYLEDAGSFPAFLAAITLDLFKASATASYYQTDQSNMSVDMSMTMIQANK